jgi:hypothetical protein
LGAGVNVASKVDTPLLGGPVVKELLAVIEFPIAVVEDALAVTGVMIEVVEAPLSIVEDPLAVSSAKSGWLRTRVEIAAPLRDAVTVKVSSGAVQVVAILAAVVLVASEEELLSKPKLLSQSSSKAANV